MTSLEPKLPEPLKQAWAAYQTGAFAAADGLCRDILGKHQQSEPIYLDALELLAAVQVRGGRLTEALASYDTALSIRPQFPDALNNRANVLKALRRLDEALADYDRAIAARPDFVEALNNRGNLLMQMKRPDEALASYDKALAIQPRYPMVLNNRGNALCALRRFDEALSSLDQALAIRPDFAAALSNRGLALAALRRFDEALASCKQALALQPGNAQVLAAEAVVRREFESFQRAAASRDNAAPTQRDTGDLLQHQRGVRDGEAASAGHPDLAGASHRRSRIQTEPRRHPATPASSVKAKDLPPDLVEAYHDEVERYLLAGDFRRAWLKYDQQLKSAASTAPPSKFANSLWDGLQRLFDRTILLHDDGAYSDTIQFCRYVPLLAKRGAHVVVKVGSPLRELIAGVAGVAQVVPDEGGEIAFDLHCPFAALPWAFRATLETIPATMVPYLQAPPAAAAEWNTRLGVKARRRIGIVWSSDPSQENAHRSIELATFLKFFDVDATFVCAQRDISGTDAALLQARPEILTFGDALKDFAGAAALLSCLDLVITVDSSMAHLAGALGRPVWVLLPYMPNWRWLLDRDDSPWYPTARLFRQRQANDWNEVLARVAVELQRFVDHGDPR